MAPHSKAHATALFDLKSATLTVLALMLKTTDLDALAEALQARYGATPGLFEHEPLCVDLAAVRESAMALDAVALVALLRRFGFNPMAVRGGSEAQMAAALQAGLAEAPELAHPKPEAAAPSVPAPPPGFADTAPPDLFDEPPAPPPAAAPLATTPALIIDKPLRSGQQVYARGGDLIVLAVVSFGAEVIADGSIHVYAPLRGRALAGARGNTEARIFAACMEPQLVSIGGVWRTFEAGLPADVAGKAAQARLDGDKLLFEPLKF
ncbi:MAG: septum site-determining protein MinC [Ideonella sp. MAG2]|nr:MAG: septum site-determining protein MinC [Ideonella sp. MAG2]